MNARFEITLAVVKEKAQDMTANEIQAEIDSLLAAANELCGKTIHSLGMQDTRDRINLNTIADYTMLATAWGMV